MAVEKLPTKSLKSLFAASGNQCAFDTCSQPIIDAHGALKGRVLQLNHHEARPPNTTDDAIKWISGNDLILVCNRCGKRIINTPQQFSTHALYDIKQTHEKRNARACEKADGRIAVRLRKRVQLAREGTPKTLLVDTKGAVTPAPDLHILPPADFPQLTIGDDVMASNYIAYLILRYNAFAAKEAKTPAQFNAKTISQNLRSRYKKHWKDLPRVRFPHVCRYLKHRIDMTRIGKANAHKGLFSYRSFDTYLRNPHKR